MNTPSKAQKRYIDDAIMSASPARLLTMLYDRLLLEIDRAELAQREERWVDANTHLLHAQSIVTELTTSLSEETKWNGAAELRAVYSYLASTLISANLNRDPDRTHECRDLVSPLREAWHAAAGA